MVAKGTEYAIRALGYVQLKNWEQKRPGVGEIAREINAPEAYCAKILQTLTKHELLDSMKGRGGGFFFSDNLTNCTIYDVVHVLEGDAVFCKCGFGLKNCSDSDPCPFHVEYKQVTEGFFRMVKEKTIQSLSEKIRNGDAILSRIKIEDIKNS